MLNLEYFKASELSILIFFLKCLTMYIARAELDGILDTFWQTNMKSLSPMTVMSSGNMPMTEVIGIMGMSVGGAQNTPNHKSGHSDKDSSWTLISVGPLPIVGYKNSEFHPFDTEPTGLPLHQTSAITVAIWLETNAYLSIPGRSQWPGLQAGCLLCSLL